MGQEERHLLSWQQSVLAVFLLGHWSVCHTWRDRRISDAQCAAEATCALHEADDSSFTCEVEWALHEMDVSTCARQPEEVSLNLVF